MSKGIYIRTDFHRQIDANNLRHTNIETHKENGKRFGKQNLIKYNKKKKGKTYKDQYGETKAEQLKKLRREQAKKQQVWKRFPDTKGSNNPRWIGGTIQYRGEDWNKISKQCLYRDNYICRKCGRKDHLGVHHIIPYRKTKDNYLNNLITLCPRCHTKMENEFRRVGETNYVKQLRFENARMELELIKNKLGK